ncbi:MAG: hypothetical protein M0Q41_12110 [Bacteroidales bacterium]|nr:hypothetical protein [Bacteroidales bacterium]
MRQAKILCSATLVIIFVMIGNVLIVKSEQHSPNIVVCYEILELGPAPLKFDVYFCGSCTVKEASAYFNALRCRPSSSETKKQNNN